ncbi:MAG: TlpA disulfide reductase family protein [Myxococcota bacterium]
MAEADPVRETTGGFLVTLLRDWGLALGVVLAVVVAFRFLLPPDVPSLGHAPDFTLPDLAGEPVTLSELDDDVVVLNFWFTDCPPCRAEIPELSAFAKEHPEVPIYGLSTDRMTPGRLRIASERLGIAYPVLHDARAEVAISYGVSAFPTTLVVKGMEIVDARVGGVDRQLLEQMVASVR